MPKIDIAAITPRQGSGYPAPFHEKAWNGFADGWAMPAG